MKIRNDLSCRPVRGGHLYEYRERGGWMTVVSYEVGNGVYFNLMNTDLDEITNRDNVDAMNLFGIPIFTLGSGRIDLEGGGGYTFRPGDALFGVPLNRRLHMVINSRRSKGITVIFSPDASVGTIGDDPGLPEMISVLRDRLGVGLCTPFHVPLELRVIAESIILELEENRCRNAEYLTKRAVQAFHVLYRVTEPDWADAADVRDNGAVDRICCRMIGDFGESRTIKELCAEEGVDDFWFIHNFRRRYGMNPREYTVYSKHIRSAALLLTGKYTVAEVVGMVGYSSRSKFTVAFREVHGCNPMDYVRGFDSRVENFGSSGPSGKTDTEASAFPAES